MNRSKRKYIAYTASSITDDSPMVLGFNHMLVTAISMRAICLRARHLCELYNNQTQNKRAVTGDVGARLYLLGTFLAKDIKGKNEKTVIGHINETIPIYLYSAETE